MVCTVFARDDDDVVVVLDDECFSSAFTTMERLGPRITGIRSGSSSSS